MANKYDPKNLDEALAIINDLDGKLTSAAAALVASRAETESNKTLATALQEQVAKLNNEINILSQSVGLNGGKGLPKEVQEDIARRVELGLSPVEAVHAALRQHKHNETQAAKKKATAAEGKK